MDETAASGGKSSTRLLKDLAYDTLRRRISDGSLRPGERISERNLATELSMSKTPVKAALERLEEQGFITISPQKRAIVRSLDEKEISDHYDLRIALESFVMSRVTGRLSSVSAEALEENLAWQREITRGDLDLEQWARADYEFHLTLARSLDNDEISRIVSLQRDRLFWLVASIALRDPEVPAVSCSEHESIYAAVRDGHAERAARLVTDHLENGKRFLLTSGSYGERSTAVLETANRDT